ncbi:glycoside hydrolase family 125 protein [Enterococcus timonensis]|uniref:glycoside hydrolase family 125 protein n=1 Tax=Enterococcus timonensis TaxID=1852364 RepID=UPI0008D9F5DC|nr:glycoside hydrolase family 125 protein [Enterococcus timonensis]
MEKIPTSVQTLMDEIVEKCGEDHKRWGENFKNAFANTSETTVKRLADGSTFVLTGDIPAMWLRDSTAQVRPYLILAKNDPDILAMIAGLSQKQFFYVNLDPYANAFNETDNFAGHQKDKTAMNGWIWERKYEIDSLCYPLQLAYLLYKNTGSTKHFDDQFVAGVKKILTVFTTEQHHATSPYTFERETTRLEDTLPHDGRGNPVGDTGLTWSGFRPSDDACQYGYLIPSNMFAAVVLQYVTEIFTEILPNADITAQAQVLRQEILDGLKKFGTTKNNAGETIYAYEVDGLGQASLMDDANVPNLMAAPYLGFGSADDAIYQKTRKTLLSKENPFYYEGSRAAGIGSSHTPENYIWPISLAMEGLTTDDRHQKERILNLLVENDANTKHMHESFHVDDDSLYTREWFSWANMMFCELLLDYYGLKVAI